MFQQPRYNPQSKSDYFEDGRTMRTPVTGTVSRTFFEENEEVGTGRLKDDSGYVLQVPEESVRRAGGMEGLLARGQERFGVYCTPCHDKAGTGNGSVVQRGFQKPPSLHDARIRQMPDGQLYATIAYGIRNMPAYGPQIPTADRWAIVAYVRALELSQLSMNVQPEPPK
ncbi:MAG: cytochrome c [Proteobacteria bacterium]|nr:MAG: cytochrome c [Pseudomonadota bacterium]